MYKKYILLLLCVSPCAVAGWHAEMFITGLTWHNPATYPSPWRSRLNDVNGGGGIGFEDANRTSRKVVYLVQFSDSLSQQEPLLGGAYLHRFGFVDAGVTAGITRRPDVLHDSTIPFAAAVVSKAIGHLRLYAAYLPPVRYSQNTFGDIVFLFAGWVF